MKYYLLQKILSGRTHLALATLTLILQRSPLPRIVALLNGFNGSAPAVRIIQSIALPAAALGLPHALSGASTSSYTVDPSNPATFQTGETIVIGFTISIAPKSWTVEGDLPPGLRLTDLRLRLNPVNGVLATNYGVITGVPTQAGTYPLTLTPWEKADGTGDTAPSPLDLTIIIEATDVTPPEPTSPPEIRYLQQNQNLQLIWQHDPQTPYTLKISTDLKTWNPIEQSPLIENGQSRIEFPITNPTPTFYRLSPQ